MLFPERVINAIRLRKRKPNKGLSYVDKNRDVCDDGGPPPSATITSRHLPSNLSAALGKPEASLLSAHAVQRYVRWHQIQTYLARFSSRIVLVHNGHYFVGIHCLNQ